MATNGVTRTVPVMKKPLQFGSDLKSLFPFDNEWINLNHGM